ncbi:hypothetical protein CYMTET_38354 [Cymbomonas tetramitiformis]|uniref:C-type lectin domain-containing protein n=1 Tax=Cymbomonas tetramitiformis TaxID=36881 RepID=A0AAE0CDW4_9CHLO|nr:hypothetical protein CYMTET_38354 [Cymbomonas tetramitiformis]
MVPGYFDECPDDNWFRLNDIGVERTSSCYYVLNTQRITFYDANYQCSILESSGKTRLAALETQMERDAVHGQLAMRGVDAKGMWFGGTTDIDYLYESDRPKSAGHFANATWYDALSGGRSSWHWIDSGSEWDDRVYIQSRDGDNTYNGLCTIGDDARGIHAIVDSSSNAMMAQNCDNDLSTYGAICELQVERRTPPPYPPPRSPPSPMPPPLQSFTVSPNSTVVVQANRTGKVTCLRPADMPVPPDFVSEIQVVHASAPNASAFRNRVARVFPDVETGKFTNFTSQAYCVFDAPGLYDLGMRMHFAVTMSDGTTYMDLRFVVNLVDDAADPYDPAAGDDLSDESLVFTGCRWDVDDDKCDAAYPPGASGYASLVQRDRHAPGAVIGLAATVQAVPGLEEQFIDFVHAAGATHEEFGDSAWAVSPDAAVAQPTQRYDGLSVVRLGYRAEALDDPFRRVATRSIDYAQHGTTEDAIAARVPLLMGLNNITVTMTERVPQAVSARSDSRTHVSPLAVNGYYPLYSSLAECNYARNTSAPGNTDGAHTHVIDDVTYHMPNGLLPTTDFVVGVHNPLGFAWHGDFIGNATHYNLMRELTFTVNLAYAPPPPSPPPRPSPPPPPHAPIDCAAKAASGYEDNVWYADADTQACYTAIWSHDTTDSYFAADEACKAMSTDGTGRLARYNSSAALNATVALAVSTAKDADAVACNIVKGGQYTSGSAYTFNLDLVSGDGWYSFDTCGSQFDTLIKLYHISDDTGLEELIRKCDDGSVYYSSYYNENGKDWWLATKCETDPVTTAEFWVLGPDGGTCMVLRNGELTQASGCDSKHPYVCEFGI